MRIGILTYHCQPNFGAQLQALSTVGYLKRNGHTPILLNWYPLDLEEMYDNRIPSVQVACHASFTKAYLPVTKVLRTEDDLVLEVNNLELDAIILGSDALFKYIPKKYQDGFSFRKMKRTHLDVISCDKFVGNPFFGTFLTKLRNTIPASVYAVSSQNCPFQAIRKSEKRAFYEAFSNFREITVRDEWTRQMVMYLSGRETIRICPDPVFSFNQNCYIEIPAKRSLMERFNLHEDYILLSFGKHFISSEYINDICTEIVNRGMQPVFLPMPEGNVFDLNCKSIPLPLSPIEWYSLIVNSRGYIGERMHPIVVCLHNSIPFFCFDEYGTSRKNKLSTNFKFKLDSSKTYDIIEKADLLEDYYSYKTEQPIPNISNVVDSIFTFNKERALNFSEQRQNLYEESMNFIMNSLLL